MTAPRVLLCGAWDDGPGYPRARSLEQGLNAVGYDVARCRVPAPWLGKGKRRVLTSPWLWPSFMIRSLRARALLRSRVREAVAAHEPEAILVPYPGHLVADVVARAASVPVALDLFLSAMDTAVGDRALVRERSTKAKILRGLERRTCRAVDRVLLDTPQHAEAVADLLGLEPGRFGWVPVGDPEAPSRATVYEPPATGGPLRLLFFGTGVPLHGLETLIQAVHRAPNVHLTLIGGDPRCRRDAIDLGRRIRLLGVFEPRAVLDEELHRCHLVAGVFGTSAKASQVVPFKVVHGLAAGRPIITADTPAIRAALDVPRDGVVVEAGNAGALAEALEGLVADPGRLEALAQNARLAFDRGFAARVLGERLAAELNLPVLAELQSPLDGAPDPEQPERMAFEAAGTAKEVNS